VVCHGVVTSLVRPAWCELQADTQPSQFACVPADEPAPTQQRGLWERYTHEEAEAALQRLSPDALLMRWVNSHLARAVVKGDPVDKRIHNFTSDFIDGEAISVLLHNVREPLTGALRCVHCMPVWCCSPCFTGHRSLRLGAQAEGRWRLKIQDRGVN